MSGGRLEARPCVSGGRGKEMRELSKMIVIAVDGSATALRSVAYIRLMYSPAEPLELVLLYVIPALPRLLTEDPAMDADMAQKLKVSYDPYYFLSEAHPKLRPVETNTAGIFVCGSCQAPKDIPETVAQASGAAAKVCGLFSNKELSREPIVAVVNRQPPPVYSTCVGCFLCESACPYQAIEHEDIKARDGKVLKTVAKVNQGVCQGCGTCVALCRTKSIDLQGFTNEQVFAELLTL